MNMRYGATTVTQVSPGNRLPIRIVAGGSGKAVFIDLVAAVVVLLFALKIDDLIPEYMFGGQTLLKEGLPLLMIAVASFLALRGLVRLKARTTIEVDGRSVSVSAPHRIWARRWSEPLANYQGVRWTRFAIHDRRGTDSVNRMTRYQHVLELAHPNAGRTVPLFLGETGRANAGDVLALVGKAFSAPDASEGERLALEAEAEKLGDQAQAGHPRARWEALAATLGLPAIDARDGANEVRAAPDLDKSIKARANDGTIDAEWNGAAPPASLSVEQRGNADDLASQDLHVTIHAANTPKAFLFLLAGFGGVLLLLGVLTLSFGAIVGALLFGGAALGIWYLQRTNPHQLTITRNEIRYHDPLVSSRSFVVPLSEVESIKIRDRDTESARAHKTLKLSGRELLISSDRGEHAAGGGLDDDALEWLRGYLVAALVRA